MSLNNVATMLSDLGRREEALDHAEQAVRIQRHLAAQRPDAFLPNLARSLAVRGTILAAMDRHTEARQSFEEAIRLLAPAFTRLPQAHANLMRPMCRDYIQACEAAGEEPDITLLAPIAEILQKLQQQ